MSRVYRLAVGVVFVGVLLLLATPQHAQAIVAVPIPEPTPQSLPNSPILLTAYLINDSSLELVQLYNNSSEVISLEGGRLLYGYAGDGQTYEAMSLSGLMRPHSHVLISTEGLLSDTAVGHFAPTLMPSPVTLNSLAVVLPGFAPASGPAVLKTNNSIQQRGKTSTGYSSVTFGNFEGSLYADLLYQVPMTPLLRIVEVSPRAKACEPFSVDPTCGDFIKLKALPGFDITTLPDYRLRTDTGSESVTNTFSLAYASHHDGYVLMRLRDDGELLSLTNSGGYLWLEDSYGIQRYDETLTGYADAGSEDFINRSWALDESDSTWKWGAPNPTGANVFPEVLAELDVLPEPTACPAGKYRNPETNRCRSIEEAVSALATCEEGKERNPVTNRCRSIATLASVSLTPCDEGEERNPATNRCRKVVSIASSLVPCESGYERNPETNRCRKSLAGASGLASPAAADTEQGSGSSLKTALIVTAGMGALGYGFYEWRYELLRLLRRLAGSSAGK